MDEPIDEQPAPRDDVGPAQAGPVDADLASGGRLLVGWALIALSAIMLATGWWGVSGQPVVAAQLAYLASGGVGGLLAGIVGVGLLISHDLRKDRERLGRVESAVLEVRQMLVTQSQAMNGQHQQVPAGTPARGRATRTRDAAN